MSPQLLPDHAQALLALADGTVFQGHSIGAAGHTVGEVVFNTALTGYQEILTDPSYCRQIVTLTYPHIGNYGVNAEDVEAAQGPSPPAWSSRTCRCCASNFRSDATLGAVPAARGHGGHRRHRHPPPDARCCARGGAQNGCIVALPAGAAIDAGARSTTAIAQARAAPSMAGLDLAKVVSVREPYEWTETEWALGTRLRQARGADASTSSPTTTASSATSCACWPSRGCRVTVVPAQTPARRGAGAASPTASSSPTARAIPEPCDYAIAATRELIDAGMPTFGICLGHQIMALASGAQTFKMKFGHHGANHPVKDLDSGRVSITSQNHGFAVDEKTLPANLRATHVSLFDGTLQGLARTDKPAFCFQGHPEASPGPHDIGYLFDRFVALMDADGRAAMPKRTDLHSILIIGAGPIVIGQACEFDYSGAQACKALREEGYRVVLVNSNPATIMTDPEMADVTYIEPITWQVVEKIIAKERPDAVLPTMGGQTALNCALDLHQPRRAGRSTASR